MRFYGNRYGTNDKTSGDRVLCLCCTRLRIPVYYPSISNCHQQAKAYNLFTERKTTTRISSKLSGKKIQCKTYIIQNHRKQNRCYLVIQISFQIFNSKFTFICSN